MLSRLYLVVQRGRNAIRTMSSSVDTLNAPLAETDPELMEIIKMSKSASAIRFA